MPNPVVELLRKLRAPLRERGAVTRVTTIEHDATRCGPGCDLCREVHDLIEQHLRSFGL